MPGFSCELGLKDALKDNELSKRVRIADDRVARKNGLGVDEGEVVVAVGVAALGVRCFACAQNT